TTAVKTVANVVKSVVQTVASAVVKILPRSIQNVIASTGLVKVPEKKKPPPPEKKCKPGLDSCDCPSGMTLEDIPGMGWRCKAACGAPVCPEGTQPSGNRCAATGGPSPEKNQVNCYGRAGYCGCSEDW